MKPGRISSNISGFVLLIVQRADIYLQSWFEVIVSKNLFVLYFLTFSDRFTERLVLTSWTMNLFNYQLMYTWSRHSSNSNVVHSTLLKMLKTKQVPQIRSWSIKMCRQRAGTGSTGPLLTPKLWSWLTVQDQRSWVFSWWSYTKSSSVVALKYWLPISRKRLSTLKQA